MIIIIIINLMLNIISRCILFMDLLMFHKIIRVFWIFVKILLLINLDKLISSVTFDFLLKYQSNYQAN